MIISMCVSTCPVFLTTPFATELTALDKRSSFSPAKLSKASTRKTAYSGTAGLGCDCCVITNVDAKMKDGVLGMIVSRVKVNKDDKSKCTLTLPPYTGKSGRDVEDHPYLVKGRKGALFWDSAEEGGAYISVDIPGVSKDDVIVFGDDVEITCHAESKNVYEHDESGHLYRAKVINPYFSSLPANFSRTLSWTAEFGVLKISLTNPNTNTTTNANN
ncbi:hypothetical protein V5N11_005837 [Cardamine amara subsp. amara]|uniref:SHSP domain-containing protein n=1 Tax=Cardamine amara subsp. amara TaxID=228776 RepID=A0ABD1C2S5_CARAN